MKAVPKAPAPTDDDTGDELLDTRVDGDNEGLPFINPEGRQSSVQKDGNWDTGVGKIG